uniref:Uncharacterized protein n=1 Tax=Glossina austeni TaxID=7395 RepID=A0A1A9UWS1_GLOAU
MKTSETDENQYEVIDMVSKICMIMIKDKIVTSPYKKYQIKYKADFNQLKLEVNLNVHCDSTLDRYNLLDKKICYDVTTEVMKLLAFVQIDVRRKCALVTSTFSYVKGTSLLQTTCKG